ncbi:MAG: glycerol-3-phosphate dehydrogenase/oxidase [Bryobacteraceae bacterium]|nr:glycerol-3-phosphate dehydrogenase/oxidase [Bryobacteraceae bacterium]
MTRGDALARLRSRTEPYDLLVIGGGATGASIALDAASRGYSTALVERHDFGEGTSSRSTKLVHGGVRYLEQGNVPLVMEALHERGILKQNAPHLVSELGFIVPNYEWWEAPFYGIGLRLYDLLAGRYGFGASRNLSRDETLLEIPTLKIDGLRGGVVYFDGQFDDARLLIQIVLTAIEQGASAVNHCEAIALSKGADGFVEGVRVLDRLSGQEFDLQAKAVINATGAFSDRVRQLADPNAAPMIAPSQGVHLVFDKSFLPSASAILVPHTADGRVMFAIPWHGHTLVGTTDTAVDEAPVEPVPFAEEIDFILETAAQYLDHAPSRHDILSAWAGIRPLVKAGAGSTAALSRDHSIHIDRNGLLTIAGGKWTTCRKMAEDCVNQAALLAGLIERECVTRTLRIHGFHHNARQFGHLGIYGSDATRIQDLARQQPDLAEQLDEQLPYTAAEVVFTVRHEMAQTLADLLSRRLRALPLNARAALRMAPRAAELMAAELGKPAGWADSEIAAFTKLTQGYLA